MKDKLTFSSLLLLALFSALAPAALASTTWYVNGVSGSDSNNCKSPTTACKTIGHAISLVSSGDSIVVAAATYTENLTISISLKIIGSSASATIIDGGGRFGTVVGISTTTATVVLSGLTIRNGNYAGGVYNAGILTITHSTISGNSAYGTGGGIFSRGTLTINDSTISGNVVMGRCGGRPPSCQGGAGGGIFSSGTLTINDSTVSGNVAELPACHVQICSGSFGGGIYNSGGKLTISNTTISGNRAYFLRFRSGGGGGIAAGGTVKIQNSIVANNSFLNCYGTMTSNGYNMSNDSSCGFSNSGDRNNTDPMLGPLQNNGGQTQTMALLPGSPAIDAGNPSGCTDGQGHLLTTDQRDKPRPDQEDKRGCDIGAFERQSD